MSFQVQPFLGGNLGLCCSLLALWVPENHFDEIKWNGENSCSEEGREGRSCQGCCPLPARKEKLQIAPGCSGSPQGPAAPGHFPVHRPLLPLLFQLNVQVFPSRSSPLQPLPSLRWRRQGWLCTALPWEHLLGTGWRWRGGNVGTAKAEGSRSRTNALPAHVLASSKVTD